jgi:hypothetical protein
VRRSHRFTGDEIAAKAAGESAEVIIYGYTVPASEASER